MVIVDGGTSGMWQLVRYTSFGSTMYVVVRPYATTSADTILAEGDLADMNRLCSLAIEARDGG